MASIKIDSKIVVEACIKSENRLIEYRHEISQKIDESNYLDGCNPLVAQRTTVRKNIWIVDEIKKLAEYSTDNFIYIDHNDFQLIGEYLPKFNKTTIKG